MRIVTLEQYTDEKEQANSSTTQLTSNLIKLCLELSEQFVKMAIRH